MAPRSTGSARFRVLPLALLLVAVVGFAPVAGGAAESPCAAGRTLTVAGRTFAPMGSDLQVATTAASVCMGCHDGTVAGGLHTDRPRPERGSTFLLARLPSAGNGLGSMPGANHPVGMRYPENDRSFVPRHRLDPRLRLEGGRVGCSTCHGDPEGPAALSIPNRGSALCFACHRK